MTASRRDGNREGGRKTDPQTERVLIAASAMLAVFVAVSVISEIARIVAG